MSPPIAVATVRRPAWLYFTAGEAVAVEAIVDRLIPPDKSGPGGKEAGCAVFIDRQLAGAFGNSRRLYMRPPFARARPSQGLQSPIVPKERYRLSLATLDVYCKASFAGKVFAALSAIQQDQILLRPRERRDRAAGRQRQGLLRSDPGQHDRRFFRRSDLRWQSRHGGLEARSAFRALATIIATTSPSTISPTRCRRSRSSGAAIGRFRNEKPRLTYGNEASRKGRRNHRAWLDWRYPREGARRPRARRRRDRARPVARHGHLLQHRLRARRAALRGQARSLSADRTEHTHVPQ